VAALPILIQLQGCAENQNDPSSSTQGNAVVTMTVTTAAPANNTTGVPNVSSPNSAIGWEVGPSVFTQEDEEEEGLFNLVSAVMLSFALMCFFCSLAMILNRRAEVEAPRFDPKWISEDLVPPRPVGSPDPFAPSSAAHPYGTYGSEGPTDSEVQGVNKIYAELQ